MRCSSLLLFTLLLACGDSTVRPPTSEPAQLTQPAPGVTPTPATAGTIPYTTFDLGERSVDGCSILLREEGTAADAFVFAMGYPEEPAEMTLDGAVQRLAFVAEREAGPESTHYTHANDRYEVMTTVTVEDREGNEVFSVSGRVEVRDQRKERRLTIRVVGEQGC